MSRALALLVVVVVVALLVVAVRSRPGDRAASVAATRPPVSDAAATPEVATPAPATPAPADTGPSDDPPTTTPPTAQPPGPAIPDLGPHPELRSIDGWLQSDVASLEELRGKVVVVQFWTFGCVNCKNTLPNLRSLYASTSREDVEFVGVHAPEFSHEAVEANIAAAAAELDVTWPIALDTTKRTFHHWQEGSRAYWPRTYVLDRDGHVRFDHIGEGAYEELNATVTALVADPGA